MDKWTASLTIWMDERAESEDVYIRHLRKGRNSRNVTTVTTKARIWSSSKSVEKKYSLYAYYHYNDEGTDI